MKIAIAILNYNGKNWLEKFLPTLIQFSQNASIYVLDNASTDDSLPYLQKHFPEVKVIKNTDNYGFAKGYNQGLETIEEEIYCLLNSDVEVTENWLQPIIPLFEKNKNISAIQPKILDYKNKQYFEYAGAGGGCIDNLGYSYCRGRMFFDLEKDQGQYNDVTEIFWATGACFFIRKEDFRAVNGFDEDYFAHWEEIDLCWRLKNQGKQIFYTGKSTVYHVGGGTLDKNSPKKTFLNFRNSLFTLVKNLPAQKVLPIIFLRLVLDGIAGVYFLFKNGYAHTFAIVKAHFSFYAHLVKMWKKRKQTHSDYYQDTYILFKYYSRKK